jgi:hypothetical protein
MDVHAVLGREDGVLVLMEKKKMWSYFASLKQFYKLFCKVDADCCFSAIKVLLEIRACR